MNLRCYFILTGVLVEVIPSIFINLFHFVIGALYSACYSFLIILLDVIGRTISFDGILEKHCAQLVRSKETFSSAKWFLETHCKNLPLFMCSTHKFKSLQINDSCQNHMLEHHLGLYEAFIRHWSFFTVTFCS